MVTLIAKALRRDELAHHFGTIGYEVLTSLGKRYARIYKAAMHCRAPSPPPEEPAAASS